MEEDDDSNQSDNFPSAICKCWIRPPYNHLLTRRKALPSRYAVIYTFSLATGPFRGCMWCPIGRNGVTCAVLTHRVCIQGGKSGRHYLTRCSWCRLSSGHHSEESTSKKLTVCPSCILRMSYLPLYLGQAVGSRQCQSPVQDH